MRMRLGEAMKLVAILAVGLGVGEWAHREMLAMRTVGVQSGVGSLKRRMFDVRERSIPIFVGLTVATGVLVLAERARRGLRKPWGVGRWSASAGFLVLLLLSLRQVLAGVNWSLGAATARAELTSEILFTAITGVNWDRSIVILACFVSARFAGWTGDPQPDAIESFGRLLLVATCVITIGYQIAICFLPP